MTVAADLLWQRVHRRALSLTPDMARAFFAAFDALKRELTGAEIETLIAAGNADALIQAALNDATMALAFAPVRAAMLQTAQDGVAYFARDIPGAGLGVAFDVLNPRVVDALRVLDDRTLTPLQSDIRETVRQVVGRGLVAGAGPRAIARDLRDVVGLAPNQEAAIQNFEAMLRAKDAEALTRTLRDHRFDATLQRALGTDGPGLPESQIATMANAYRRRMAALNTETQARTATLNSLKLGQRMSWQDAIDKGVISGDQLSKTWRGVMDDRERETHIEMEGETVPFDQPYSNGEMEPGESTFNCRCLSVISVAPAPE